MTDAIPSIALAIALTAALFALEAFWLIRQLVKRLNAVETMTSIICRFIVQSAQAIGDEKDRAVDETKRVN